MISKYPKVRIYPVHGGFTVHILDEVFAFSTKEKCGDAIRAFMLNPKKFFEDYGIKYVFPPHLLSNEGDIQQNSLASALGIASVVGNSVRAPVSNKVKTRTRTAIGKPALANTKPAENKETKAAAPESATVPQETNANAQGNGEDGNEWK